jgi:hypothetical protein
VPRLFAVNRPLLSSKRRRMPLRGMLGNGLRVVVGAVAASEGSLVVETRGHRLTLAVDPATGVAMVTRDQPVPPVPGLAVHIVFGPNLLRYSRQDDGCLARDAIAIASHGTDYRGPSSPWWYSPRDLAATLVNHGASSDEIAFLRHSRVELNAMPSEVFVRFLERKLTEHGVCKVVPADDNALKQHARRVIAGALITRVVNKIHSQVGEEAEVVALPVDLRDQVLAALERQPEIPWDLAVADIARKALDGACVP